jgi:hypothetical protein
MLPFSADGDKADRNDDAGMTNPPGETTRHGEVIDVNFGGDAA